MLSQGSERIHRLVSRWMIFSMSAVLLTGAAFAQDFSFGVKGGARLTDDLQSYSTDSESKRYTVGPTAELKLSRSLSVEIEALYKRLGTSRFSQIYGYQWFVRDRANSWKFPILAKYSLPVSRSRFFVSGGMSFRHISGLNYQSSSGAVVGGGIEINAGPLTFAPEFRYTGWFNVARQDFSQYIALDEKSAQNQAEILVGIRWHPFGRGKSK